MKRTMAFLLALLLLLCTGCSNTNTQAEDGRLQIICTIFPEYDWCRTIAGDHADITMLLKSGMDLHNFEPTAQDIASISNSDVFIYVGGASDDWAAEAMAAAENKDLKALRLMDTVTVVAEELVEGMEEEHEDHDHDEHDEHEDHDGHEEIEYDEHIWLSLKGAALQVQAICDTLCAADPDNAGTYSANTAAYLTKLTQLDGQYADMIAASELKTILVADRFPFRYLADDYGLTYYAAFPGCAAASDVSFETVAFLSQKLQELQLPAIITIDGSDGEIARTILQTAGSEAAVLTLNSCQCVTQEELQGTAYYDIMTSNLELLREALNTNGTD